MNIKGCGCHTLFMLLTTFHLKFCNSCAVDKFLVFLFSFKVVPHARTSCLATCDYD